MARTTKLRAPAGGCTVRMYRHGLGDCFLLAFGLSDNAQRYMLIDCGVLIGTKDAEKQVKRVVRNIRSATGGHLDALVITHEHWDHVSGFAQAQTEFSKINVDKLWLAWTENPANPLARELRERKRAALNGIRIALSAAGPDSSLYARQVESVKEFFGPDLGLGAAGRSSTEDALQWAKERWPDALYCDPGGTPLTLPGLPDVRFFVLGPPADAKYIRKSRPSSRPGQVYLDDAEGGELGMYLTALGASPPAREATSSLETEPWTPFNRAYHLKNRSEEWTDIKTHYKSESWRGIDADWQGAAGELALRLDAHTNNTSLVLAIELATEDKVLLFPGDAQVGNWLSWNDVRWDGDASDITAVELLHRTVLYKVSHHGSHNATLRDQGLEQMTNPELAALIPVERETAAKMRWRMPHQPLYERLKERTLGRLILSDAGLPPAGADEAVEAFRGDCVEDKLYVDVTIRSWAAMRAERDLAATKPRRKRTGATEK